MKKLISIITISLYIFGVLYSQSEYLDESYGDNGTLILERPAYSIQNFSSDSDGNIYISVYDLETIDALQWCLYKIKPNGDLDSSFGDQGAFCIADTISNQTTVRMWQENDFIIQHYYNIDSLIRIYNTDLELLREIRPENPSVYNYNISINKDQTTILNHVQEMYRYKADGTLDNSFGTNGVVKAKDISLDSLNFYFVKQVEEGDIYVTSFIIEEEEITTKVIKLNNDGTLNEDFNPNGVNYLDNLYYVYDFHPTKEGKLVTHGIRIDTSCLINLDYVTTRLNADGSVDQTFGDNGELSQIRDCDESWAYSMFNSRFTDGKLASLNINFYVDADSLVIEPSSLTFYSESGHILEEFGEDGEIVLDFLPLHFFQSGLIDDFNNIYMASIESSNDPTNYATEIYVTKFAGHHFVETTPVNNIDNGFTILNNPSKGDFILDYQGETRNDISIKMYDLLGRLIVAEKYPEIQFGNQFYFDNYNLAPSSYILKVSTKNESTLFSGKVLVVE